MPNISDPDDVHDLDDPPAFDGSGLPVLPPRLTLADQIRHIVARLRHINDYDRQRLRDIAVAVARREEQLGDKKG